MRLSIASLMRISSLSIQIFESMKEQSLGMNLCEQVNLRLLQLFNAAVLEKVVSAREKWDLDSELPEPKVGCD